MELDRNQTLEVFVRDRERVLLQGQARSITGNGDVGKFDVLPWHANFITLLKNRLEIDMVSGGKQQFDVQSGILRVIANKVEIYLGI